jgi:dTMP kinase
MEDWSIKTYYIIDKECESGYVFPMYKILDGYTVFEGLDGAGTTTQAKLLAARLASEGFASWMTFEPTSGNVGQLIRRHLSGELKCHPGTLAALFVADRYEHLYGQDGILSRLDEGVQVIGDRYLFSSLAYQSLEIDFDEVFSRNCGFPLPQRLIYIDTDPEECERRMADRAQKELFDEISLQKRVRELYERAFSLYEGSGMEIHRFEGSLSREVLAEKIWSAAVPVR